MQEGLISESGRRMYRNVCWLSWVKIVGVQLSSGVKKAKKTSEKVEPDLFMSLKDLSLSRYFWEPL